MRLFKPTPNPRLNELIGFLGITAALLIALSLLSYSPHDPSLNVAAPAPGARPAGNWIGPVGAHVADLLFQGFGFAAFLLPVGILVLGLRWFTGREVQFPWAKLCGFALLGLTLTALFALWELPAVRGALPPGGALGVLFSEALLRTFNTVGANLVVVAGFLAALFMTTRFSFTGSTTWVRDHVSFPAAIAARWRA